MKPLGEEKRRKERKDLRYVSKESNEISRKNSILRIVHRVIGYNFSSNKKQLDILEFASLACKISLVPLPNLLLLCNGIYQLAINQGS